MTGRYIILLLCRELPVEVPAAEILKDCGMNNKIRWGILGCGKIANKFASDLKRVADAELVAIGTRDPGRAKTFADNHHPRKVFPSYEALAESEDVDAIYVATPHGMHFEHVMLCLRHRKAVLCEKAFALNLAQARQMIDYARREKVFLMEAFWTKFLPQYDKVMEIIRSGQIGEVRMIQADFGFRAPDPRPQRLYDPALGGGSLLDIGIYPVFLAQSILGKPTHVHAFITPYESGVDEQCVMTLKFAGGLTCGAFIHLCRGYSRGSHDCRNGGKDCDAKPLSQRTGYCGTGAVKK